MGWLISIWLRDVVYKQYMLEWLRTMILFQFSFNHQDVEENWFFRRVTIENVTHIMGSKKARQILSITLVFYIYENSAQSEFLKQMTTSSRDHSSLFIYVLIKNKQKTPQSLFWVSLLSIMVDRELGFEAGI